MKTAKSAQDTQNETTMTADSDLHLRPMFCELNALTRADGSALFTQGSTAVMASVYGPIEGRLQQQKIDKAYVDVHFQAKSNNQQQQQAGSNSGLTDRLVEQIIRQTCETALLPTLHPRTAITVQLQEMEDGGGLVAASVNAACLALLNSGIAMRFRVAAVHCAITDADGTLLLNPDGGQQNESQPKRAELTFVFESVSGRTVAVHTNGRCSIAQYNDAQQMCAAASAAVFEFQRQAIAKAATVL